MGTGGQRKSSPGQQDRSREPSSVAHDRSRDTDTQRRSFSQNRESDELGSELERETGIDESDEEDMGGPGRSDR